ncbi:MAG: hypothetical protein NC115_02865 [Bacteroidales bacterium]|nr:hypothetical protein [Bacteroides sp.]MCM1199577.1 hypothetical protein [Clostridium sp.]MCM1501596.1 hypothetical protein [Bacteroidales bacterium]
MEIRQEYLNMGGAEIWEKVVRYVKENGSFTSVTGIPYTATFVGSCIFLKGGTKGTKRADEGEYLTGKDFIAAYDAVKNLDVINTAKVKPYIRRQQTPFIGLLVCAGIIELEKSKEIGEDIKIF